MMDKLVFLAKILGLLAFCYAAAVAWARSAPVRSALGSRAERLIERGVEAMVGRWDAWITAHAMQRVSNALVHLSPAAPGVPTRGWLAVIEAAKAWTAFMPFVLVAQLLKIVLLALALFNLGTIVAGVRDLVEHPPGGERPRQRNCVGLGPADDHEHAAGGGLFDECMGSGPDPLAPLENAGREAADRVWSALAAAVTDPWGDPVATTKVIIAFTLLVMAIRAVWGTVSPFYRAGDSREYRRAGLQSTAAGELHRAPSSRGETAQWQPVVVLLAVCTSVGLAYRQLESRDALSAPRVSLKTAERAVWSAWRTRHGRVRRARRNELKRHAAEVVGALRAMEARQDSGADTAKVFEDTAVMLLKIAQRYAEGRTLALLDPGDLSDVTPAHNREWVRLVALGLIVTGTVAGALAIGLPDAAATPLIGVVSLLSWTVLYGGRMVGTDLVDVMRGQSRG
ncbi:hypothetical protein [Streptomyces fungicidicus]|uniref:hypothetical protein n=1 Tax=Streptomyces fungicidicus TaxID=68203 RepID=UPI0013CEA8BC|nr:hypothetical protein [Streptomyces fungicidicus]